MDGVGEGAVQEGWMTERDWVIRNQMELSEVAEGTRRTEALI